MSIELITGHGETDHISSYDMRAFNRSVFGKGRYVFEDAEKMTVTPTASQLKIEIASGSCMWSGMHIRNNDTETLRYISPADSDYVYVWLHYTKDVSTGVEKVEFAVTTAATVDTSLIFDAIDDETSEAYTLFAKFYHNKATTSATKLTTGFENVASMKSFFEEVTQKLNVQSADIDSRLTQQNDAVNQKILTATSELSKEISSTATDILDNVYNQKLIGESDADEITLTERADNFQALYIVDDYTRLLFLHHWSDVIEAYYHIDHSSYVSLGKNRYYLSNKEKIIVYRSRTAIKKTALGGIDFESITPDATNVKIYGVGRVTNESA